MTRILIVDSSAGLSAAVIAQLRGLAEICDSAGAEHLTIIGVDHGHEPVDLRSAVLRELNQRAGRQINLAAWQRANLTIEAGEPFITPTRAQGKQVAQWKRERSGRR